MAPHRTPTAIAIDGVCDDLYFWKGKVEKWKNKEGRLQVMKDKKQWWVLNR